MSKLKIDLKENKFEQLAKKDRINILQKMLEIRRFEEKTASKYSAGEIGGFCHLYIGQEAVAAGIYAVKNEGDAVITSYRDHGQALLSGLSARSVFAELFGRATGSSKGKGGSMHIFNIPGNFYGGHGIVGAQVSLGTGIAFAKKYQKKTDICITMLGDGTVHQGQVHESFNIANLWGLPVLYIIENNEYSMGTSVARSSAIPDLYLKGQCAGIPGFAVDGMNVIDVFNSVTAASKWVRENQKPLILEMKTYRYRGHSMSDPGKYRSREEIDQFKKQDPIENFKSDLIKNKFTTEKEITELDDVIKKDITDAMNQALNDPEPDPKELMTDIYYTNKS